MGLGKVREHYLTFPAHGMFGCLIFFTQQDLACITPLKILPSQLPFNNQIKGMQEMNSLFLLNK
jgi:hypothetical protein